jgi:hypothetical protein
LKGLGSRLWFKKITLDSNLSFCLWNSTFQLISTRAGEAWVKWIEHLLNCAKPSIPSNHVFSMMAEYPYIHLDNEEKHSNDC